MHVYYVLPHTAENIATLLKECSEVRYQMGTRLDSITTYNGANFKAAVQQLLDEDVTEENPACACHTFSLVKNAIHPCKNIITVCCNWSPYVMSND